MSIVLDAGALVRADKGDRRLLALTKRERLEGRVPITHGGIVGQVWRSGGPRQAQLAQVLRAVEVVPLGDALGRSAGRLLARAGGADVLDAALVAIANSGDQVLTSDPEDVLRLIEAAQIEATVTAL